MQSNGGLSSMEQGILNFFNLVVQIIFNEIDAYFSIKPKFDDWILIVMNFVRQVVWNNFEKQVDVKTKKCLDQVTIKY